MRRIAVGGVIHETHTFNPIQTTLDDFTRQSFVTGEELVRRMQGTPTAMGGALQGLGQAGDQVVPLLYTAAMPNGTVHTPRPQYHRRRPPSKGSPRPCPSTASSLAAWRDGIGASRR